MLFRSELLPIPIGSLRQGQRGFALQVRRQLRVERGVDAGDEKADEVARADEVVPDLDVGCRVLPGARGNVVVHERTLRTAAPHVRCDVL